MNKVKAPETLEQLTAQLKEQEAFVLLLQADQKSLDAKWTYRQGKIAGLKERIDTIKVETGTVGWEELLFTDGRERSKVISEMLDEKLPRYSSLYPSGYFPNTQQVCLQLCLYKKDDARTQDAYDKLMEILPYLKALPHGYKVLSVFDRGLSEFARYEVRIRNNQATVIANSYGRESEKFRGGIKAALDYVQKNLYYKKSKEED